MSFCRSSISMMASGLITLEKVQVLQYGKEGLKERAGLG